MFRHERFLLYGTVLLLLCVLTNILVISNITKTETHSVPDNSNNTKTQNENSQNVTENANITIVQNLNENNTMALNEPENSDNTFIQTFSSIFYSFLGETLQQNIESPTNTTTKLINLLTDQKTYNKNLRPNYGEKTVDVNFHIYITDIISVSDYNNDISVNMVVYEKWVDPRLQFTPLNNVSELELLRDSARLVWLPDVHNYNAKSLSMQLSDSTLTSAYVRVYSYGKVFYANTFSATANCPMDLAYFPVDQQICKLVFRSYSFNNKNMHLNWDPIIQAVYINSNISLSTFTLTSFNASKETLWGTEYLNCELRFKRTLGYYINQIYVPSFMIVVVSWIPFWLNRADHYARVGLGVTTVLTITTMVISTNESLPKTSYIKAIDVYLFVCFLMVFLAMVEFAMIGFFEFEEQSYSLMETKEVEEPVTDKSDDDKVDKSKASKTKKRNTARIDTVSRVLFPTVFITFNLIYGGVLYYISNYFYIDDFRYKYEG